MASWNGTWRPSWMSGQSTAQRRAQRGIRERGARAQPSRAQPRLSACVLGPSRKIRADRSRLRLSLIHI
eukprot:12074158-Alexandrium_andersonii.AAC.1